MSCICGYRCHLTLNCSSALCLELSVSFLVELQLVTLKIWFRTSLVEFFGPCKNQRTAPFCPVAELCWMMMKEVYVCGLQAFEPCTCYFPKLFLCSEWRCLPTVRTSWSCNTGFYTMSRQLQLNPMTFKRILEDILSLFSIPKFLGLSGWRLWLVRVFQPFRSSTCCGRFVAVLYHVVSGHPALACSTIISFWGRQAKIVDWKVLSNIQEFIINTIPTYLRALHVVLALSCLQFVLALRNW